MTTPSLSTLVEVPVREIWKHTNSMIFLNGWQKKKTGD